MQRLRSSVIIQRTGGFYNVKFCSLTFAIYIIGFAVFATQGLTRPITDRVKSELGSSYELSEKYIFGDGIIMRQPPFVPLNYNNAIITKLTDDRIVENNQSQLLQVLGLKNIATIIRIYDPIIGQVYVLNVNINNCAEQKSEKQLIKLVTAIMELMKEESNIILTGNFDMNINGNSFNSFVEVLDRYGLNKIPINPNNVDPSFISKNKSFIFVPKEWIFLQSGLIKHTKNIGSANIDDAMIGNVDGLTSAIGTYAFVKVK